MKIVSPVLIVVASVLLLPAALAKDTTKDDKAEDIKQAPKIAYFEPEERTTHGSVTIGGNGIDYEAVAGTLVVHPKGWDDAPQTKAQQEESATTESNADDKDDKNPSAEASIFYVSPISSATRSRDRGRSPFSTMAGRAPRPCGCTWVRSARAAW